VELVADAAGHLLHWPGAWRIGGRQLAVMLQEVGRLEIIAVAGDIPSAYGIGWDQRPRAQWMPDTGLAVDSGPGPDDHSDPGIRVLHGSGARPTSKPATRSSLAA
jgi:hypothetical protein